MNDLLQKNYTEVSQNFEEINNWLKNFQNNTDEKLNQLEKNVEEKFENLKKSGISNINVKGEKQFANKNSINYFDKTESY